MELKKYWDHWDYYGVKFFTPTQDLVIHHICSINFDKALGLSHVDIQAFVDGLNEYQLKLMRSYVGNNDEAILKLLQFNQVLQAVG